MSEPKQLDRTFQIIMKQMMETGAERDECVLAVT